MAGTSAQRGLTLVPVDVLEAAPRSIRQIRHHDLALVQDLCVEHIVRCWNVSSPSVTRVQDLLSLLLSLDSRGNGVRHTLLSRVCLRVPFGHTSREGWVHTVALGQKIRLGRHWIHKVPVVLTLSLMVHLWFGDRIVMMGRCVFLNIVRLLSLKMSVGEIGFQVPRFCGLNRG